MSIMVSRYRKISYISTKSITTLNIMVIYYFNMYFTFALARWGGIAHDACVFLEALKKMLELGFSHPYRDLCLKI